MMDRTDLFFRPERAAGLAVVLALHAAALWGLWQHRLIPSPQDAMTLFVNFIAPPLPEKKLPHPPTRPQPAAKPQPRQIVASVPVVAPTDFVAPLPPTQPAPIVEALAAPSAPAPTRSAGPVALGGELSVACSERTPPRYPPLSRRMGEEGIVVLRVELDERGKIGTTHIATSSGYARLDSAALEAVRSWQCTPTHRDGQSVRSVALQPFKFILQES